MTIQMLRCFTSVAKHLSFSKAADELFITQPAVTHQVQMLESELDVRLLDRTQRSVALTPSGISFYGDAADILERISLAVERVHDADIFKDTLYVGCQTTLQMDRLPQIYEKYRECCPDIYINTIELSVDNKGRLTQSREFDAAFLTKDCADNLKDFRYYPLVSGRFCCVVPTEHRLAGFEEVSEEDLAGEVLICLDTLLCPPEMSQIQTELRRNCVKSKFYRSTSSIYTVLMIRGNLGIAVMPDFVCPSAPDIAVVPYKTDLMPEFGIAVRAKNNLRKIKQFVTVAQKVYSGTEAPRQK
ncbi:MAG: LysR family transcriptional regulator [Clostridiales bacterium]|nr:LysR family transcriptional regulator [Clostridiales bacterium]